MSTITVQMRPAPPGYEGTQLGQLNIHPHRDGTGWSVGVFLREDISQENLAGALAYIRRTLEDLAELEDPAACALFPSTLTPGDWYCVVRERRLDLLKRC